VRISSAREAELRATASLLSAVKAVAEFGRKLSHAAGAPKGRIDCFTEVTFTSQATGKPFDLRPDGVIAIERGRTRWLALVEVKVGNNELDQGQIDAYHKLAREIGAQAVITVSNQAARANGEPPVTIDRRRARAISVIHFSWDRLLSEAKLLSRKRSVEDVDQAWILDEWIRYVADPNARILESAELGDGWGKVVAAARVGNLGSAAADLERVAENWDGFLRKLALRLRADLGAEVEAWVPRKHRSDPALRIRELGVCAAKRESPGNHVPRGGFGGADL